MTGYQRWQRKTGALFCLLPEGSIPCFQKGLGHAHLDIKGKENGVTIARLGSRNFCLCAQLASGKGWSLCAIRSWLRKTRWHKSRTQREHGYIQMYAQRVMLMAGLIPGCHKKRSGATGSVILKATRAHRKGWLEMLPQEVPLSLAGWSEATGQGAGSSG